MGKSFVAPDNNNFTFSSCANTFDQPLTSNIRPSKLTPYTVYNIIEEYYEL